MLWFALGIVVGAVATLLIVATRSGRLAVRWYQWILGVAAVGFALLAVQNYLALQEELEPALALFSLVAFGIIAVVAAALVWVIPLLSGRAGRPRPASRVKPA